MQIQHGNEVIAVAARFPTMIALIIQYGVVPVFKDVKLVTLDVYLTDLDK